MLLNVYINGLFRVAYELAKAARISDLSQVWERSVPSPVKHIVFEELSL